MGKLHLLLPIVLAACTAMEMVPASDYRVVPQAERTELDNAGAAALARARVELAAAVQATSVARTRVVMPATARRPAAVTDPSAQAKTAALTRVDAATRELRQVELTWCERRVDVATSHVTVVATQNELARATAVDRYIDSERPYEVALYRGQMARAQEVYYAGLSQVAAVQAELQRARVAVGAAKEAYAQLVRMEPSTVSRVEPVAPSKADAAQHGVKISANK